MPPASTFGPIEEVLLKAVASAIPELRSCTAYDAALVIASMCIVAALSIASHHRLTLLVTARALPGGTLEPIPAVLAIRRSFVWWTVATIAWTDLLRITLALTGPAYAALSFELTILTAVLVCIVTNGTGAEGASRGIAAGVVATACSAAAVALFALLDDAVAASWAGEGNNVLVIR